MRPAHAPVLAAALLLAACAARAPAAAHAGARHAAEAAFVAADEAFSAASAARDEAAFARLVAADAVFFSARGLRDGRAAVVTSWRPFLSPGGPRLTWTPERAETSAGGDLGFTVGRWVLEGEGETVTGQYVTVWRRAEDGRVEAVLDGTFLDASGAAPAPATALRVVRSREGDLSATLGRIEPGRGAGAAAVSLVVTRREAGRETRRLETRVPLAEPPPAP